MTTRLQVRRVLLITLLLNLLVAFGKIALGILTGALAITADGFHSLTDGAGNIAGLIANVYANQPPDDDHPYGHRRFESLAALLIGGLLLLTAWEMVQGVFERLQAPVVPDVTPLTFAVLGLTLVINIGVSRYQIRAGKRLKSEILLADAKNTRADVFVTLSVIFTTFIMLLTGWVWVDVVAALIVVVLIGRAAWQIVQETGGVLVDRAPYSPDELRVLAADVPGVQRVVRARSRGAADSVHIDIDVQVAREMTAAHTAAIAQTIRQRLQAHVGGISEVEVHFVPCRDGVRDVALAVRARADALGLATHDVLLSSAGPHITLEMHVEVAPNQTLEQAHAQVYELETALYADLPQIDRIETHIEPVRPVQTSADDAALHQKADDLEQQSRDLLAQQYPAVAWHDIRVRPMHHGFALTLHAALPAQMTIEAAHNIAEAAETTLRGQLTAIKRVTIHTEPYDHDGALQQTTWVNNQTAFIG